MALLYGGDDIYGEGESLRDMWQWDGAHWSEIVLSSDPGPRNEMGMVYDSQRQVTVLHSGLDEAGPPPFFFYKDTWEYDSTPVTSLVTCQNLTTAQTIQFSTTGSSWDCAAAGLKVSPGDLVQQAVRESRVD